ARSGLIVGAGDRSDRFGYWPGRLARARVGEQVLVPPRDHALQVIDVDDLAAWLVRCAVDRTGGIFNAMGEPTTLGALFEACVAAVPESPELVEAPEVWLQRSGVRPWMGPDSLPLWLPQPEYAGFMTRDTRAAGASGLRHRPLTEVIASALAWERERGLDRDRRAGLTPAAERDLLERLTSR
ncbi:MAG: oxidoreductase, partial [Nocardioides sp.]